MNDLAVSAADIVELERVAALGWRGLDEERLGDWLLRAGNGFTGRANSALPIGDPGRPVRTAIAAVADWYHARSLRPMMQVPLPLRRDVDDALDDERWRAFNRTHVLVAPLRVLSSNAAVRTDLPELALSSSPSAEWLGGYRYRGAALPEGADRILARAAEPVFATVRENGSVIAVGRGVVDEGWLGVTAVTVDDAHRRRGLGTHVMRGLAEWGVKHKADRLYLQVAAENVAALEMYARLGLSRHHDYHYRVLEA